MKHRLFATVGAMAMITLGGAPALASTAFAATPHAPAAVSYPPTHHGPYSTESANLVDAMTPVTLCAENFSHDVSVGLSDNGAHVLSETTNSDGAYCVVVMWKWANVPATPATGTTDTAFATRTRSGRLDHISLVADSTPRLPAAAEASRVHTMTFTGHDKLGVVGSTSQTVTVVGALKGSTTPHHTTTSSGGGLPFTGADIVAMIAVAAGLIAAGVVINTTVRQRRTR